MDLKKYIRSIPDYPKKGILFRDITTLIKDPEAFKFANEKIIKIAKKIHFDKDKPENHNIYIPKEHNIITGASCTTNCIAPIIKVLHENIGINHGSITTIHNLTNSQTLVDIPHNDLRRGRSAINNLIPTTTGSAKAISLIYPELKGKLNGHAVRVPILNSSLTDCVFEMKSSTNKDQINNLLKSASENELKNILGYEERPLVSTDFINDPRSSVIDSLSTMVVNDTQVKIYAWYDNEWGYANRLVDIVNMVIKAT